jgi:hypothetical protein
MKLWLCLTLVCVAWVGLFLGLTQVVGLHYPLPVIGSGSWFDRGREPVSDAKTVSFLMPSMHFDPARAAPLRFLVLDCALTAHNIGPPGQPTLRAIGTHGPFAELPLKAGNSTQRIGPFLSKMNGSTTQFEESAFCNSL